MDEKIEVEDLIEVTLNSDEDFLKVKETLKHELVLPPKRQKVVPVMSYSPQTGQVLYCTL